MTLEQITCPCCGFKSLIDYEKYDICKICGREDDPVQKRNPLLKGGANNLSLLENQNIIFKKLYQTITEYDGFEKDKNRKPISENDIIQDKSDQIDTGLTYFYNTNN